MHGLMPTSHESRTRIVLSKRFGLHRVHANFSVDKKTADRLVAFLQSVPGVDAQVVAAGQSVPVK